MLSRDTLKRLAVLIGIAVVFILLVMMKSHFNPPALHHGAEKALTVVKMAKIQNRYPN